MPRSPKNPHSVKAVIVKTQGEKSLRRRHPWIFSGAVAEVRGDPVPGETVEVLSVGGHRYGRGAFSPSSQIRVRMWTFDLEEAVSPDFLRRRFRQATGIRRVFLDAPKPSAFRLVNAESDGLPGLIVDRYADFLVCQFLTAGAEFWKSAVVDALLDLFPDVRGIYERSDVDVRGKEGLEQATGLLAGKEPPELVEIADGPYRFFVDIRNGHKTGFYLDQRENRGCLAQYAAGAEVLNCFSYTGGFAVAALAAGARSVVNIDSSNAALELANRNIGLNGLNGDAVQQVHGDVFSVLRDYRQTNRRFDLIIMDPPKFVRSRRDLERSCRGYKDVNLLAFGLLKPGGNLMTFSCSGLVTRDLFQKIVADAALDAGREGRVLRWLSQSPDHPTALSFPEGTYLKGLLCRVAD